MRDMIAASCLIVGLAMPAAAGPYKDASEKAEKAYLDCIEKQKQKKSKIDCGQQRDEYLKAYEDYRNSNEFMGSPPKQASATQPTLESLQNRIEELELRLKKLENDYYNTKEGHFR